MNNISFNGLVTLAPKVEKAIMEKEFLALQAHVGKLTEDVFIRNREVVGKSDKYTGVLLEGVLKQTNKPFREVFNIPKA